MLPTLHQVAYRVKTLAEAVGRGQYEATMSNEKPIEHLLWELVELAMRAQAKILGEQ